MSDKQATGKVGENMAAEFLQKQGFAVIERNYRHRRGEIDLIVQKDHLLLFVEVKTRTGNSEWGYPEEAVTRKKARQVISCANHYIFKINWQKDIRFDIIAIQLGEETEISWFQDAFY